MTAIEQTIEYCKDLDPGCANDASRELRMALKEAVAALYFDDSADYGTALWKVVEYLGGQDAADLLENDEEEAYHKYCSINTKE
jgi:hypothetical protein